MANGDDNAALKDSEDDFGIPGESDEGGGTSAPPAAPAPATTTPSATATPSAIQAAPTSGVKVDASQKVHPHVAILAGLAKAFISSIQGAQGNPNNAFDRGFAGASPQAKQMKQAEVSKALSEADQAKLQTSITGMKALQYEYLLKRLPQEDQLKHLESISAFKENLIKEGANVEAEGDDEKASDAQAFHMNGTDPRALNHTGRFYSLPTMTPEGKPKFDVVYVPSKDTLQNDFKWTDPEGNEQTISAGTPISGALGKFVELQQKGAQTQTKDQHKQMAEALGPVSDEKAGGMADWLERGQKANDPLYQQNKDKVDAAIPNLRAQADRGRQDKIDQAKAMSTQVTIPAAEAKKSAAKAGNYYHWQEDGETKVGKGSEVPDNAEPTPIGGEKEFAQYQNESHMSNIVQQSLNRVHQDIDQHPEIFDNAGARNILATTLEQIDRTSAGMLVAGTGGTIPLPSGMGAMINTALQNKTLDPTTADAVKNYIADYKAMKDKALVMQMEMQGGKIGRGSQLAFKSITDQIPNGETADSRSAHRQMNDLQETQDELSKKYGDYGDFKKIPAYKPLDKGKSSTDADRLKKWKGDSTTTRILKKLDVLGSDEE
jgi:hypothetical protein